MENENVEPGYKKAGGRTIQIKNIVAAEKDKIWYIATRKNTLRLMYEGRKCRVWLTAKYCLAQTRRQWN